MQRIQCILRIVLGLFCFALCLPMMAFTMAFTDSGTLAIPFARLAEYIAPNLDMTSNIIRGIIILIGLAVHLCFGAAPLLFLTFTTVTLGFRSLSEQKISIKEAMNDTLEMGRHA